MANYVNKLRQLIAEQVETFIAKVMRDEYTVDNGKAPLAAADGTARIGQLMALENPRYVSTSSNDGTSKLYLTSDEDSYAGVQLNNNPLYPSNMVDRLNTPFDHIERILLQDFSGENALDISGDNYFKGLFNFEFSDSEGGVARFSMNSQGTSADYSPVDSRFNNAGDGGFLVDSFTYTPFIDYSVTSPNIGIYSDTFLKDYNSGRYEEDYSGEGKKVQTDVHRHKMSSSLYELKNLDNDLYTAKVKFREAIAETDSKAYIYIFCEHLASLFAKLSNIRMSHEIYGFKYPHSEWEGMLALDIWYQMLYKEIDAQYPFKDQYFDMNPMSRLPVQVDADGEYVEYDNGRKLHRDSLDGTGLEWIPDDTVDQDAEQQFAFIWDASLWERYKELSKDIRDGRRECVLPRGVLSKLHGIVCGDFPREEIVSASEAGEFDWFYQKGKVYSDSTKSEFSKYVNLHLGRAYELMTAKEYCALMGVEPVTEEEARYYIKPEFKKESNAQDVGVAMLNAGCDALEDAFSAMKDQGVFNIFNQETKDIEAFDPERKESYSQAQCAIVIERVFSMLYKYLQFKSTTGETFRRHINIDSGYKYLTTDTIRNSENPVSDVYYSDEDPTSPNYMRYLAKLEQYSNSSSSAFRDIGLDESERKLLGYFIDILKEKPVSWLKENWDLCPLCKTLYSGQTYGAGLSARALKSIVFSREEDDEVPEGNDEVVSGQPDEEPVDVARTVVVQLNIQRYMQFEPTDIDCPEGFQIETLDGKPSSLTRTTVQQDYMFNLDLSKIASAIRNMPRLVVDGTELEYNLLGFSDAPNDTQPKYRLDRWITASDFADGMNSLTLYAVWDSPVLVKFSPGNITTVGTMQSIIIQSNRNETVPVCGYTPSDPSYMLKKAEYYSSSKWEDVDNSSQETVCVHEFSGWECVIGGRSVKIPAGQQLNVSIDRSQVPVITLVAQWTVAWNIMRFVVDEDLYCRALVNVADPTVPYVESPTITVPDTTFIGWDMVPGSMLPLPDSTPLKVVDEEGSLICGEDVSEYPIVCVEAGSLEYETQVNARLHLKIHTTHVIQFKFVNQQGEVQEVHETVGEGAVLPGFHIHSRVQTPDGKNLVFRYWKLESGDISPSMVVLSDLAFVAVYDEVSEQSEETEQLPEPLPDIEPVEGQSEASEVTTCPFLSASVSEVIPEISPLKRKYCKYLERDPKDKDYVRHVAVEVDCPYARLLVAGLDVDNGGNDVFNRLTLLEIADISNLIKVLFKVNLDIAHREYYLKVDVPEPSGWWYGYRDGDRWISFEPTVEFKFSNFHAANQVEDDRLLCTVKGNNASIDPQNIWLRPVNNELFTDAEGNAKHFNDFHYYYDYKRHLVELQKVGSDSYGPQGLEDQALGDWQRYYAVKPLCLYKNADVQSPVDVNDFIRRKAGNSTPIPRSLTQVRTFTSIVKKYRPIVMPNVRSIFNDCVNDFTKYEVDVNNDYGVFGWCTIPSKTMVNMEYNEQSIIVPSTYDHHNRVGGNNFLQMDSDFEEIYKLWSGEKTHGEGEKIENVKDSWYYLYAQRDWTYFLKPFFNIDPNSELFSFMRDIYPPEDWPALSDHINGVIFERSNEGRAADKDFGDIARTCQFLARYHHNEKNLKTLAERYIKLVDYSKLKSLTDSGAGFNSMYGSKYDGEGYEDISDGFRFPYQDWIDDYDKTGSYLRLKVNDYSPESEDGSLKYRYNLGQSHAIDDFDEDSVWFYITMTEPVENLEQVLEVEDIMPFVFWWENRGHENNGPTAYCYGKESNAKLNYERGGWCYSNAHERCSEKLELTATSARKVPELDVEQSWHAVQHTIGTDFSKEEYGGTILATDNSGNVYKGAFDPNCSCTNEKWKIHHETNAFGAPQQEDPSADKYYLGESAHGDGPFVGATVPDRMNSDVVESIHNRPMTWNLWNVVRHYVYIKYFKNRNRALGNDQSAWNELEYRTKKYVKNIYRTFQEKKRNPDTYARTTFGDRIGGLASTNSGSVCSVNWTNSFVEISSILEVNARKHSASFVLFTGDIKTPDEVELNQMVEDLANSYVGTITSDAAARRAMALGRYKYSQILESTNNFRITTTDDIDCGDDDDGMRPRVLGEDGTWVDADGESDVRIYQGFKYGDMPTTYILGDTAAYSQRDSDISVQFSSLLDIDQEFPEAEYYLGDTTRKWVKRIRETVMNRQIIPVYTSMESMTKSHHDLTETDMKSITFQVVPQFYWKYEWSFNEYMIHRVGKLNSPSSEIVMYDMLGNVWEWVRDDWSDRVRALDGKVNPMVGTKNGASSTAKVIRGGAFDQFCRSTIASSREGLGKDECKSRLASQENVGFRPSMTFTVDNLVETFQLSKSPVDLFFLFDASASQDTQMGKMVDAAESIIKLFSPVIEEDDTDATKAEKMQMCNVGSALFLGPKIRLMCSAHTKTIQSHHLVKDPNPGPDKTTLQYSAGDKKDQEKFKYQYDTIYEWVKKTPQKNAGWYYTDDSNEFSYPSGQQTWFEKKFNELKKTYEEATAIPEDETDDDSGAVPDDGEEERMAEVQQSKSKAAVLMGTRDSGTGPTDGGHGSYGYGSYGYYSWYTVRDNLYVHRGVQAWQERKEGVEEPVLHMEQDNVFKKQCNLSTEADRECHVFTYDSRPKAMSYFDNPFVQSVRGVLVNWYNGSEPVCQVLAELLGGGFFHGFPYTPAIGYMFRNQKIPKLVFVFTNEFDNSIARQATTNGENVMVVPGVVNKNQVKFYPMHGVYTTFNGATVSGVFQEGTKAKKLKAGCVLPPDPFCLQQLNPAWKTYGSEESRGGIEKIVSYLQAIDIDRDQIQEFQRVAQTFPYQSNTVVQVKPMAKLKTSEKKAEARGIVQQINRTAETKITNLTTPVAKFDGQRRKYGGLPTSVKNWTWNTMRNILTDHQIDCLLENKYFPGLTYKDGKPASGVTSVQDRAEARTIGFYQLKNTTRYLQTPMNVFLFSTNANAPRMLDGDDLPFLANDSEFVMEIRNKVAVENYQDDQPLTWGMVAGINASYLAESKDFCNVEVTADLKKQANVLNTVVGLHNPYKTVKIIWGLRRNGKEFSFSKRKVGSDSCETWIVGCPMRAGGAYGIKNLWNYQLKYITSWADWTKRAWKIGTWFNNTNNCRMKLTEQTGDLYVVVMKKGKTLTESTFNSRFTYKNIAKTEAYVITRLVSEECIRYDNSTYNTYGYGDNCNTYAFSRNFAIDDAITIAHYPINESTGEPDTNQEPIGITKIIAWTTKKQSTWYEIPASGKWTGEIKALRSERHQPYDMEGRGFVDRWKNTSFFCSENFAVINSHVIYRGTDLWVDTINSIIGNTQNYPSYPEPMKKYVKARAQQIQWKAKSGVTWLDYPFTFNNRAQVASKWTEDLEDKTKKLYGDIETILPFLLAHRFQSEVFAYLKNGIGGGASVIDYDDDENVVTFSALPAYNYDQIQDIFQKMFAISGKIDSARAFSSTHCIIDINPYLPGYNTETDQQSPTQSILKDGQFPIRFVSDIKVNEDDEYKTSKIVLQKIEAISAGQHDQFRMGSGNADYDRVVDENKIKYSGNDVILTQSVEDSATVVLGNGGSYQKRCPEYGDEDQHPAFDLYNIPDPEKPTKKKKYKKNKHFFIDPFELTIAQWCYVHGMQRNSDGKVPVDPNRVLVPDSKGRNPGEEGYEETYKTIFDETAMRVNARTNLRKNPAAFNGAVGQDKFEEIERSYWKYITVWEKDEWNSLIQTGKSRTGATLSENPAQDFGGKTTEQCVQWLIRNEMYDPLDDTRPYYYATYSDVRGTTQVYQEVNPNSAQVKRYVIDSAKGDEFQMNTRAGNSYKSFMDILNNKVVHQTRERIYKNPDPDDGGLLLDRDAMTNHVQNVDKNFWDKYWCAGKAGGLNFDLPTEAQWEYCCRAGSNAPIPPDTFLGDNFEENDPSLDLIAWYKYKLIGSLPEPERFCTWRISKMLFGMSKDKEQINNVYEYCGE